MEKEVNGEFENEIVEQLKTFERQERSARRKARRHNEASLNEMYERIGWEATDSSVNIEADYEDREEKETLAAAMERLTEKQQRLVRLYYYESKTEAEIAALFGVSKMAISYQLGTVHKTLKKYF